MTRRILLTSLLLAILVIALFFRKLGLGELAVVAAIMALTFGVESVRFVIGQFLKGYGK